MHNDPPASRDSRAFPTTAWAALAAITQAPESERSTRRNGFIERYWKPIFWFLRARGYAADQAEELTQAFFVDLLVGEDFLAANPERGKFRTFLLTLLKRFLSDRLNPSRRPRQDAFEAQLVSISGFLTDEERCCDPPTTLTPETVFLREWACALIARVHQQVQKWLEGKGRPDWYRLFLAARVTVPEENKLTQEELGALFGIDRDAVRYRLEIVRQAFDSKCRVEIRDQVGPDVDVEEEIRELLAVLEQ
jgi:RNA polymerase sigma-70 factor (ECF subfamily)